MWKVIYLKKRMHSEFWLLWVRFIWDLGFPKYKISMLYAVALWFPGHLGFREELSYMFNISKTRLGFHGVDLKCQGVSSPEERLPWYIISSELSVHLAELLQLYWDGKDKKIPSSCQIFLIAPVWIQCLKNSLAWWTSSLSEMWESSFLIAPPNLAEQGAGFKTLHTLKSFVNIFPVVSYRAGLCLVVEWQSSLGRQLFYVWLLGGSGVIRS